MRAETGGVEQRAAAVGGLPIPWRDIVGRLSPLPRGGRSP